MAFLDSLGTGFLGTRADFLMDIILIAVLAVPFILLFSFRSVRKLKHSLHAKIQWALFLIVLIAVIIFEIKVRLSGGSGSLLRESSYADVVWFRAFLLIHISIAVFTYASWGALLVLSGKKWHQERLPGPFSINHKLFGKGIFAGATFTAFSGLVVYLFAFVY